MMKFCDGKVLMTRRSKEKSSRKTLRHEIRYRDVNGGHFSVKSSETPAQLLNSTFATLSVTFFLVRKS